MVLEQADDQSQRHESLSSLKTLPQILSALSSLESEEAELSASLQDLLASQDPILASLSRLQDLSPRLDDLHHEAFLFSDKVSSTAGTAVRVGSRVRTLDEEMRRVREANDRVGQVMELKSSLASLQSSIESQDWESASRHCAKVMALPQDVISGPFAETAVPTSDSHLPPAQTLQAAREQLLKIFTASFDQATHSKDAVAITRYFKLFPVVGWEIEGLEAYASFVVDLIKVRPPASVKTSSPLYYITALTALFESVAMIIDQHQPVVEKYYGVGKMTNVINRLLQECDRKAKSLIESWEQERSVKRKLADIATVTFPSTINGAAGTRRQPAYTTAPEEDVDAREIDKIATEVAGMGGRWNLFRRFLIQRLQISSEGDMSDDDVLPHQEQPSGMEGLNAVNTSACNDLFLDLLQSDYSPLEVWYTRSAIDKAHCLSKPDSILSPVTTTTPDDAFYILKVVLSRLLSTGSVATIERTSSLLIDVIEHEYAGVIKSKMDDVYRSAGSVRGEKAERDSRLAFITLLNDLDVSASHMERLVRDMSASPTISQTFLEEEAVAVANCIFSFGTLVPKFRSILRAGIEQLFNQLLRPKMRSLLSDLYKDVSYVLDEKAYALAESRDTIRKRFVRAWDGLVDGYQEALTENNYKQFIAFALEVLIRPWEKFVLGLRYTELGAIRFDHDLRSITAYLSSQTAFGDVREKFHRLQQIATLLNLDQEESVEEFYNSSGIPWKFNEQEARIITDLCV